MFSITRCMTPCDLWMVYMNFPQIWPKMPQNGPKWPKYDPKWKKKMGDRQAHFCKKTSDRRAFYWQTYGVRRAKQRVFVILSSFCDLMHIQSVVDLFAKQLYNALNVPKITNRWTNSQKYGRFSTNARLDGSLGYTVACTSSATRLLRHCVVQSPELNCTSTSHLKKKL